MVIYFVVFLFRIIFGMIKRLFGYESGIVAACLRISVKTVIAFCLAKPISDAIV